MTRTTRLLLVGVMTMGLMASVRPAVAADADTPVNPRVRSSNPSIATVIRQATQLSKAFRALVETINTSDGTVYVEKGQCGRGGVRTCLVAVTLAGTNRNLWVKVDTRLRDLDLMGSIGHELQHAVEVLSDRTVTNNIKMFFFYQRTGRPHPKHLAFETDAAIQAGEAVRNEILKYRPRTETR